MVRVVEDSPYKISGCRHVTLEYNINNKADMDIFKRLMAVLDKQPTCQNCDKYYIDSQYCGYSASMCKVNGCLDGNPQHDFDGSKCKHYARKQGRWSDVLIIDEFVGVTKNNPAKYVISPELPTKRNGG